MKQLLILCLVLILPSCSGIVSRFDKDAGQYDTDTLLKMASSGNGIAQHRLCQKYLYGEGIKKDYSSAVRWCSIAAKKRYTRSMTLYGEMYLYGIGMPRDDESAFYWNREAARSGHVHAQYITALMYMNGRGVERNVRKGLYWLKKSASLGYPPAVKVIREINNIKSLVI